MENFYQNAIVSSYLNEDYYKNPRVYNNVYEDVAKDLHKELVKYQEREALSQTDVSTETLEQVLTKRMIQAAEVNDLEAVEKYSQALQRIPHL